MKYKRIMKAIIDAHEAMFKKYSLVLKSLLNGCQVLKKSKSRLIDDKRHLILMSGHPSPLSANRGLWFGNNHFSKCNEILLKNNKEPILW